MAITIQRFEGPFVFIASRVCLSLPEAQACRAESDDPQVGSLKAGEAAQ